MDGAIVLRWKGIVPGREAKGFEVFANFQAYIEGLMKAGRVRTNEVYFSLTGSDGAFFVENVEIFELLEDTQTSYTSSRRLPPGTYYVHLSGLDEPCFYSGAVPCASTRAFFP